MELKPIVVFDFDGTIYRGDCTVGLFRFTVKRYPKKLWLIPGTILYMLLWKLRLISTQIFKQHFLRFLNNLTLDQVHDLVSSFWAIHKDNLNQQVVDQLLTHQKEGSEVVVVTASPEWFVSEFVKNRFSVSCIGTRLENRNSTVVIVGTNCKGKEKINRLKAIYGDQLIIEYAYSDNASDQFLFDIAQHAYRVTGQKLIALK